MIHNKDLQFKQFSEVFLLGTIFLVVDFAKNTYSLHKNRYIVNIIILTKYLYLSMYYIDMHNAMFMILKIPVTIVMWSNNMIFILVMIVHMIHILFNIVFDIIYDLLKQCGVEFNEHWKWSTECESQFKSSLSFFWLWCLHKK